MVIEPSKNYSTMIATFMVDLVTSTWLAVSLFFLLLFTWCWSFLIFFMFLSPPSIPNPKLLLISHRDSKWPLGSRHTNGHVQWINSVNWNPCQSTLITHFKSVWCKCLAFIPNETRGQQTTSGSLHMLLAAPLAPFRVWFEHLNESDLNPPRIISVLYDHCWFKAFVIHFLQSMWAVDCPSDDSLFGWLCDVVWIVNPSEHKNFFFCSPSSFFRLGALIIWTVLGSLGPDRWAPLPTWRGRWAKGEKRHISVSVVI